MKLVIDMNLSPRWADVLGNAGFEAAHWSMLGPAFAPDAEIMAYAKVNGCVVLTHDLDFGVALALTGNRSPSVVQLRTQDVNPDAIGKQVIAALQQLKAEIEEGALVTVDLKRTRLRILPLRTSD